MADQDREPEVEPERCYSHGLVDCEVCAEFVAMQESFERDPLGSFLYDDEGRRRR